jgi:hypothetical protein
MSPRNIFLVVLGIILTYSVGTGVLVFMAPRDVHKVNPACCSATECATQHHHDVPMPVDVPLTDQQLQSWYAGFNEEYFDDKLPKDTVIAWADLTARKYMGSTVCDVLGKNCRIQIDQFTNKTPRTTRMTIAHETCHVATWGQDKIDHGMYFQNCMRQMANKGAFENIW